MNLRLVRSILGCGLLAVVSVNSYSQETQPAGLADEENKAPEFSFRADSAVASTYVWRGQRLTNDWSLQPSFALSRGPISFSVWGTLDLAAVNEGPSLPLASNPVVEPGKQGGLHGLLGRFSEVDYTLSFSKETRGGTASTGAIVYTFPDRSAVLPTTTELYAGYTFGSTPLSPAITLFVDVDETGDRGNTGLYLRLSAARSLRTPSRLFSTVDLSSSLGIVNSGFHRYYYGGDSSGFHDFNLTATAPIRISEHWSASVFLAYSALLGAFREKQYPDLRDVYQGRPGPGKADTIWGGTSVSLVF